MSGITDFLNALSVAGVARAHKWTVIVSFPSSIATTSTIEKISLLARSTTTPASTLGDLGVRFEGRNIPIAGDRTYEDFPLTILGTNDYLARDAFESWSELINGNESNTGLVAPVDYMSDIELQLHNQNDEIVKTYILKDAWPLNVAGSELDRASENTVLDYVVTFKYLNYVSDTTR